MKQKNAKRKAKLTAEINCKFLKEVTTKSKYTKKEIEIKNRRKSRFLR